MKLFHAIRAMLLSAAMLAAFAVPAAAIECRAAATYDASTNGSTVLVTGTPANRINVCGFVLVGGGTATVKLVQGTGVACATNEVALTPAYSLAAQTVVTDSSPIWRGLFAAPGTDLCIKTSAGVAVQMQVFFNQN